MQYSLLLPMCAVSVRQSVSIDCQSVTLIGFTAKTVHAVWGEHFWGSVERDPDPPTDGERRTYFQILGPPRISRTAEVKKLKFCVQIEGWKP